MGLGQVVDGHLLPVAGEVSGGGEDGKALGGAGAVFMLAAGERAQQLGKGVGRRRRHEPGLLVVGGRWGDGSAGANSARPREPPEVRRRTVGVRHPTGREPEGPAARVPTPERGRPANARPFPGERRGQAAFS
ncbi:hypothetical protein AB4225_29430 [Streptomyces sp. 2RAF24]|uniref:hypothetical protein n=1 Tax=Streptomyces sp. 2RAF24 TaxID=3232997 RepID=UPI003F995B70